MWPVPVKKKKKNKNKKSDEAVQKSSGTRQPGLKPLAVRVTALHVLKCSGTVVLPWDGGCALVHTCKEGANAIPAFIMTERGKATLIM